MIIYQGKLIDDLKALAFRFCSLLLLPKQRITQSEIFLATRTYCTIFYLRDKINRVETNADEWALKLLQGTDRSHHKIKGLLIKPS